jgi:alkylation response protein AidB-like acyl-CoA dehydrogenase
MIARTLFGAEHERFRETVRRFLEREVAPHHADWEDAGYAVRVKRLVASIMQRIAVFQSDPWRPPRSRRCALG